VADLAIIIVTHNSGQWVEQCLTTIYGHADGLELEVVVADNESTDGGAELVERLFPEARVLRCENRGFAYGNNQAFHESTAPFVLFVNADAEILSGSLAGLVDDLRSRPRVGLVGVRAIGPDGQVNPTIRRFPSAIRMLFEALGSERFPFRASWLGEREVDRRAYERETVCDWVSGSFMLARREALLSSGLMDERFFMYCEEPDLCLRLKAAGWEVRYLPSMTIAHEDGRVGWVPRLVAQDAYARRQYMAKHFSRAHRSAGLAALSLGLLRRVVFGARSRTARRQRRTAAWAGLRTLAGRAPAPFIEPPAVGVSAPAGPPAHALSTQVPSGRR
jgi:N-acetylglucosaminyl-diphospho-decaprenol L-rhamnosyltransferase